MVRAGANPLAGLDVFCFSLVLVAARGVSQRGGASRCGSESAAKGPGERSRPHPAESLAGASAGPEQAEATDYLATSTTTAVP